MKRIKLCVVAAIILSGVGLGQGEIISLDRYMALVEKNNPQMQAILAQIEAAKNNLAATQRAVEPFVLSVSGNYTDDTYSGFNQGLDKVKTTAFSGSVTKQFMTGTGITVGGTTSNSAYTPLQDVILLNDGNSTLAPFVSLQQSLWKDLVFGSSYYTIQASKASMKAALYNLEYAKQQFIIGAKNVYWNLSYAKTNTVYREASLKRYQQLLEWNQRRVQLDLGERADLLQAQASQKTGQLNFMVAQQNERQARRAFNQFLNVDSDSNQYDTVGFEAGAQVYLVTKDISKKSMRADTLAAVETAKAAEFSQKASKNNAGMDIVLSGRYTANGSGITFSDAQKVDKPVYTIGVTLSLPLDFIRWNKVVKSYEQNAIAAQKSADSALAQEKTDWDNLLDSWKNDIAQLEMAKEVQDYYQRYVEENRHLLQRGRTTTNLLIQSEEALDSAALAVFGASLTLIMDYEKSNTYYNWQKEEAAK